MDLCISTHPVRLELSRFQPADASLAITFAGQREAERFLRAQAVLPAVLPALRELLARSGAMTPASDDDAWRATALLLCTGRLHLVRRAVPGGGRSGAAADAAPATATAAPKRGAVAGSGPVPPPSGAKSTDATPAPAQERTAALDQDVQAAGLEQAHAGAKPFCAVCERLRQERQRQADAGAAA